MPESSSDVLARCAAIRERCELLDQEQRTLGVQTSAITARLRLGLSGDQLDAAREALDELGRLAATGCEGVAATAVTVAGAVQQALARTDPQESALMLSTEATFLRTQALILDTQAQVILAVALADAQR